MIFSERFIDVAFGDSDLEKLLGALNPGTTLKATTLLAAVEGESEEILLETLDHLSYMGVELDISDLPADLGTGETAVRLRREHQLAQNGFDANALEETDPLRLYLEELAAIPVCGDIRLLAQELAAANRSEQGTEEIWTRVLNLNLSRIFQLACQHTGRGVALMDLMQEGSMALWSALPGYDDGDLEEYCTWNIRKGMVWCIIVQAFAAGVGRKMKEALEDYRTVDERLLSELGRNATLEEIAEAMHMTVEQASAVADMFNAAQTLQRAKAPAEPLPEEDDQAVEDTAYFQMRQRIADLLADLDSRETDLLKLRFGLEGGKPLTPEQAGKKLGMTPEEVVALEATALAKLRKN